MKKLVLLILSIFMLVSCGKTVKNNDNKLKETKTSESVFSLPENTEAIVNIKSIDSVFSNFKITENYAFGEKIQGSDIKDMKEVFGINPLNIKEIKSIGIDTTKNLGISFGNILLKKNGNDLTSLNIVLYIPLKNDSELTSFIDSRFENGKLKKGGNIKLNYKKEKTYMKFFGNRKDEVIYAFVKNNYLFFVMNPFNPEQSLKLTQNLITTKNSDAYLNINKDANINKGIYAYGNFEKIIKNNRDAILKEFDNSKTALEMIETYQSMSMQLSLDTKEFILDFSAKMKSGKLLSLLKVKKYNNSTILGINKNALLLFSLGINIKGYVSLAKDIAREYMERTYNRQQKMLEDGSISKSNIKKENIDEKFKEEITKLNLKYGFDVEKDLINNFDGNFSLATYDGMSISTTNYNTILTIGIKNIKTAEMVIDKLLENKDFAEIKSYVNKTVYKKQPVYIINAILTQVYIGFKDNKLIIASGKDMYDSALNTNNNIGFYKYSQKDSQLASAAKSNMIFYISFLEVIKALNNFKGMLPPEKLQKIQDGLELLDYFLIKADLTGNTATAGYILKTNSDKLFFPALIDYLSDKKEKKNTGSPVSPAPAPIK